MTGRSEKQHQCFVLRPSILVESSVSELDSSSVMLRTDQCCDGRGGQPQVPCILPSHPAAAAVPLCFTELIMAVQVTQVNLWAFFCLPSSWLSGRSKGRIIPAASDSCCYTTPLLSRKRQSNEGKITPRGIQGRALLFAVSLLLFFLVTTCPKKGLPNLQVN